MSSSKKDNFLVNLTLGGISGGISKTCVAPLERTKILLQLQDASTQIGIGKVAKYDGLIDCLYRVNKEQGFLSFWRGNWTNVLRYFPTQALNFACKDKYQTFFVRHNKEKDFWKFFGEMLLSGGAAGATSHLFVYPMDFARTRMSADVGKTREERQFVGLYDCCKKIYNKDGVRGLYYGFTMSITGIFIYRAAFFGLYDTSKAFIYSKRKPNVFINFSLGFAVETISGIIAYPIDTVRRRLMMQAGRSDILYKSGLDCIVKITKNEGIFAFFKGCFSNVLRGTGGAIVLVAYDELQRLIY